ncbi:MAG: S8 family serine peptidase [bacterium]|nr:S8 family serine peptidase [bacterium]
METGTVANHATHVAGTVGGSGLNSGGTNRGMAPQATIISGQYNACAPFCFYNSPNDVSPDYIMARETYGIELTTNSMGANVSPNAYPCSWFGDYELTSRILDGMVRQTVDRPLTQFWAAGNERGDAGCNNNSYRCMSIPASAKNIITVGATTAADALASFSSFGPTDDGRIKPEVCATGVNVTSCSPGGGYEVMSGTSMATPATAGVACLILERWHTYYPGAPDPLPEAMKALMINSANDLGNAGPDFQSGFGLVNAQRAVDQLQAGGVLQSSLALDESYERTFSVTSNTPTLEISLAWSDIPAVGNVIPTLVNDLDIRLIDPNGTGYQPWVLNPASPGSAATQGDDSVNVCEKVKVTSPITGTWTVVVTGEINIGDEQTFALASNVPLVALWSEISGQVFPSSTPGEGVPGAVAVVGEGIQALTDAEGNYSIFVPRNATYQLHIRAYGYIPQTLTVNANAAEVTQNFALLAATGNGTINGVVETQNGTPVEGATITYSFPNATIPDDLSNVAGMFTHVLPGSNEYVITATLGTSSTTQTVELDAGETLNLTFTLIDTRTSPVGPDANGYYCYESADTGYAPTFEYTSIAPAAGGPGTLIGPGTGNDWSLAVALPFNARFYGVQTGGLTVGADGWIGFGTVAPGAAPYRNGFIPSAATPNNCVYVFWDDLYPYSPAQGGQIAYYNDEVNDRFIVEYYQVPHFAPDTFKVSAQFILYSQQARPTTTGDSEFEIHYDRFDYDGPDTDMDATLGIENSTGTAGLMVYFDGGADPNQFTITAPYALRYTTGPIVGTGTVSGQITAIPATDLSTATIRIGALAFSPEADGSYSIAGLPAGQFRLEFEFNGYENIESEQFTVPVGGEAVVNVTSYRLDPPQNLAGEFDSEAGVIRLHWNPPTWGGGIRNNGESSLDALSNYTVLVGGRQPVTGIADTFLVYTPPNQGIYRFWVIANYDGGISDSSNLSQFTVTPVSDEHAAVPTEMYLSQNYPNPFNPSTSITFGLPIESQVTLDVFDITGRTVATLLNGRIAAGHHRVEFDATNIGTGVYFYRLNTAQNQLIRKMMLLR